MWLELATDLDDMVVEVEEGEFGESGLGWHNVAGGSYHCGVIKGFKDFFHKVWWGVHVCVEENKDVSPRFFGSMVSCFLYSSFLYLVDFVCELFCDVNCVVLASSVDYHDFD